MNRLKDFNDKPQLIRDLAVKFNKVTGHTIYYKFAPLYQEAVDYYEKHTNFPDLKYFNEKFTDGRLMWEMTNASFSMDMYDELRKQLDYEILLQGINERLAGCETIDIEGCREYGKALLKFAETNVDIPIDVKNDWIDFYDKYKEEYHGIKTGNKTLDETVGSLNGVVTIAAPSSHGKSTLALSLAYNISTLPDENGLGRNVLYLSFEMTKPQLLAKITSIESSFSDKMSDRIVAENITEKELSPEEEKLVKKHMNNYMQRLNHSGGYLSLVDNTSMTGYSTIEEFMACIEEHSAKLGRKFDIIFIDNVDSLKILKGERGQDEMSKVNAFITKLDAFTKTYMDGYGTCIVLLSQVNRENIKKLKAMESNDAKEISIDFTALQQYSALYERATTVLVLYSSALMRSTNQLKLMPVKLRNRALPKYPLTLTTQWEYSYVGSCSQPPIIHQTNTISNFQSGIYDDVDDIDDDIKDIELE